MANMQGLPSLQEQAMAKHPPIPAPKGSELPYDLAQMLAKQKVLKAAIDAEAQRMLQQSQGQGGKPPTVDQSLNQKLAQLLAPPQQQAGPDLQQAALGPGMNNQGAAPPNGGAIPQPQQAPQAMAAGGLARLPSNLPQSYAGGGIIAFGEKDGEQLVPGGFASSAMQGVSAGTTETPDTSQNSPWEDFMASLGPKVKEVVQAIANAGRPVTPAVVAQVAEAVGEPASTPASTPAPTGNRPNMAAHTAGPTDVETVAPSAAPPRDNRPSVAQGSGGAPVMAPEDVQFRDKMHKVITGGVDADPEAIRTARMSEYERMTGDKEKALRQLQNENIQRQQAADEAQLKAADPNSWGRWLSRFDPHSRFLGEGVAAKTYAEQDAYQAMKQKQLAGLRALQEAQATGELGDVKGRFDLGATARKEAETNKEKYTGYGTQMANTDEMAITRRQNAYDAAQMRLQAKAAGATDQAIKLAENAAARDPETVSLVAKLKAMEAPGYTAIHPDEPSAAQIYQRLHQINMEKYKAFKVPGFEKMDTGASTGTGAAAPGKTKKGTAYTVEGG